MHPVNQFLRKIFRLNRITVGFRLHKYHSSS